MSIPEPEPSLLQQLTEARKSVGRLQDDNGRLEAEVRELRTLVKSRGGESGRKGEEGRERGRSEQYELKVLE